MFQLYAAFEILMNIKLISDKRNKIKLDLVETLKEYWTTHKGDLWRHFLFWSFVFYFSIHRRAQNPIKHLKWSVLRLASDHFQKILHFRCSAEFWIRVYTPWTENLNWTSYVRSIDILCPEGIHSNNFCGFWIFRKKPSSR